MSSLKNVSPPSPQRPVGNVKPVNQDKVEETYVGEVVNSNAAGGDDGEKPSPNSGKYGADEEKQEAVKGAFVHCWNNYVKYAWGHDELHPLRKSGSDWMGLGLTIVDSIDTMWIMGLKEEYKAARDWISENLNFQKNRDVSLFETTIRVLGGLLSIYGMTGDEMYLEKAQDLGNRFLPAFSTPTGIPKCSVNLNSGSAHNPSWTSGASVLSEVGTLQLEFNTLSHYTGNPVYREKVYRVFEAMEKVDKHSGLYSVYVSPETGQFTRNHITLGALGDSFYEYLLKLWIQNGKTETRWRKMYDDAVENIDRNLVKKSTPSDLTYIAELIGGNTVHKMDHLVCFAGAMFALGAHGETLKRDFKLGQELTRTCWEMYHRTATGISPEIVRFESGRDFETRSAAHYLLRPETVESFFVLWRLTHDPIYREWGWEVFKAIDKYCRTENGFSGIRDVNNVNVIHDDLQQSFFMAETLKYLYLLFSEDELIPLDEFVFNTEAHPLRIFSPEN